MSKIPISGYSNNSLNLPISNFSSINRREIEHSYQIETKMHKEFLQNSSNSDERDVPVYQNSELPNITPLDQNSLMAKIVIPALIKQQDNQIIVPIPHVDVIQASQSKLDDIPTHVSSDSYERNFFIYQNAPIERGESSVHQLINNLSIMPKISHIGYGVLNNKSSPIPSISNERPLHPLPILGPRAVHNISSFNIPVIPSPA